jgi:hypothetical protein
VPADVRDPASDPEQDFGNFNAQHVGIHLSGHCLSLPIPLRHLAVAPNAGVSGDGGVRGLQTGLGGPTTGVHNSHSQATGVHNSHSQVKITESRAMPLAHGASGSF